MSLYSSIGTLQQVCDCLWRNLSSISDTEDSRTTNLPISRRLLCHSRPKAPLKYLPVLFHFFIDVFPSLKKLKGMLKNLED